MLKMISVRQNNVVHSFSVLKCIVWFIFVYIPFRWGNSILCSTDHQCGPAEQSIYGGQ